MLRQVAAFVAGALMVAVSASSGLQAAVYDVKTYGATGDGKTLDTAAINKAVEAAAGAGGGTVYFPAGTFVSGTIRLKSNITLNLDPGATIEATTDPAAYDAAEPNQWTQYQDFGHSHWQNSLMWGDNVQNVTISGSGLIHGKGLTRGEGGKVGNKAIALKLSHNITIRDVSFLNCGHFCLLATGVDNLTIQNIKIDTNRDGLDIDSCRNVRISDSSVNSPNDDAIVLKSSFGLGFARATENVTITSCLVSGYDIGSLLDGTFKRTVTRAPDREGPTGRVKFGTESNGGFKNITISDIVFDRSRGLALETVDGGPIEDIAISNLTMRDVTNAPIFIRLGSRMRGPEGTPVGTVRRVTISNVVVSDADPRYGSVISGIPGHDIEDVKLSNIRILYRGGLTLDNVAKQPSDLVNTFFFRGGGGVPPREPFVTPEREREYPEPAMFGLLPAYGFFIRHVKGIQMDNVDIGFMKEDRRPAFVLDQVTGADFRLVNAQKTPGVPLFVLMGVQDFRLLNSKSAPDIRIEKAEKQEIQ